MEEKALTSRKQADLRAFSINHLIWQNITTILEMEFTDVTLAMTHRKRSPTSVITRPETYQVVIYQPLKNSMKAVRPCLQCLASQTIETTQQQDKRRQQTLRTWQQQDHHQWLSSLSRQRWIVQTLAQTIWIKNKAKLSKMGQTIITMPILTTKITITNKRLTKKIPIVQGSIWVS